MNLKEKKLTSRRIFEGKIFKVDVDEVILPDGRQARRECVRHSGGAAVFFVKEGKIALVRQFRYLYGEEMYEIPAGKLNEGEQAEVSAARELEEETGYRAKKIIRLADIYPTPGYTDEIISIFYVSDADYIAQKLDDGEFLDIQFVSEDKVGQMIRRGEIKDAKTVVAYYRYKEMRASGDIN